MCVHLPAPFHGLQKSSSVQTEMKSFHSHITIRLQHTDLVYAGILWHSCIAPSEIPLLTVVNAAWGDHLNLIEYFCTRQIITVCQIDETSTSLMFFVQDLPVSSPFQAAKIVFAKSLLRAEIMTIRACEQQRMNTAMAVPQN